MSYSIDFHFAAVEQVVDDWLPRLDELLKRAAFQRLAEVELLTLNEDNEVDVDFPAQRATSIESIEKLANNHYGIGLHFAGMNIDLAVYVWSDGGCQGS